MPCEFVDEGGYQQTEKHNQPGEVPNLLFYSHFMQLLR